RNTIYRYPGTPKIVDTYFLDGKITDKEQFPVSHTIEIFNAKGLIFQYEVQRLVYTGDTVWGIDSPQSFGRNMKVEWDSSNYYSRIYKYKNKDEGKLTIKYRITEDYVKLNLRLFDPVPFEYYSKNTTAYLTANEEHFTRNFEEYSGNWIGVYQAESVTGWGCGYGVDTCAVAIDSDRKEGSYSIKLDIDVSSTVHNSSAPRITGFDDRDISQIANATAGYYDFWYYINDSTELTNLNVYLMSNENDSQVMNWGSQHGDLSNGWNHFHLAFADASAITNFDWERLDRARFDTIYNAGTKENFTIMIDDMKIVSDNGYTYNLLTGSEDFTVSSGNWSIVNTTDENGVETDVIIQQTDSEWTQTTIDGSFYNGTAIVKAKTLDNYAGVYINHYGCLFHIGSDSVEIREATGNALDTQVTAGFNLAVDTWYWLKLRVDGANVYCTVSDDGETWESELNWNDSSANTGGETYLREYNSITLYDDLQIVEHQARATNLTDTGYIPSLDNITAEFLRPEGVTGEAYANFSNARDSSTQQTPKAVAQWSFNGDAKDSSVACALDSATCDNGTLTGDASITKQGRYGQGVAFDGEDDVIIIPNSDRLNITNDITLSVWANIKELKAMSIITKPTYHQQYDFGIDGNNRLEVNWRAPDIQLVVSDVLSSNYVNTWTHFLVTINCDVNEAKFYINGVFNSSDSTFNNSQCIGTDDSKTTGAVRIGLRSDSGSDFNGTIDEIAIYNFTFTAQQVADLYNRTFKIRDVQVKDDWNATIHANVNNSYVNTTTQQIRVGVPSLNILFNGTAADQYYEIQHDANITAGWLVIEDTGEYWSDLGTVALTIDHPDKGTNYTTGVGRVEDDWTTIGGLNKFNDSTTSK
ncbi:MAG: LamG domain-containing protein, partial [Candidatus Peribacteraceae bacterium]|nr:LamG domain-containing protein [Candidatus Peribacteraceae bacterium]